MKIGKVLMSLVSGKMRLAGREMQRKGREKDTHT
jgi:hypothetical protein